MSRGLTYPGAALPVTITALVAATVLFWYSVIRSAPRKDADDEGDSEISPSYPRTASHLTRAIYKAQRRKDSIRSLSRKKPMYDNIRMYSPEGSLLCTISEKKARWYLRKRLAHWKKETTEKVDNECRAIQLNFTPKHGSASSSEYTVSPKRNICVACGCGEPHTRHYIVPYCYRQLLPTRYKTHMPHDIVILCPACHLECEQATQQRQQWLEDRARVDPTTAAPTVPNKDAYRVRSCAIALTKDAQGDLQLPESRKKVCQNVLRAYFDIADTSTTSHEKYLKEAMELEANLPNPDYIPGAQLVVDQLEEHPERTDDFVRAWREHFVEVLQPRYMPKGWSIDSSTCCDER